jgi:protein phosphatase
MTLRLHYAVRSDVGHVRDGNEDSAYAGSRLVAVADGMGGHAAGEVASSVAITALAPLDDDAAGNDLLDALADALEDANAQLRALTEDNSALDGMGTTVTALLSAGGRLAVAHVGDSRLYLLRDGELTQVTHDHTFVQDLVDTGRITAEQASSHPQRALLTRALDGREAVRADLSVREARRGDRYLLCTDGLSGVVSEETITDALQLAEPQAAADRLVELALKGGGPDNITVVVADVVEESAVHSDAPVVAGAVAEKGTVTGAAPIGDLAEAASPSAAGRARRWAQAVSPRRTKPAEPVEESAAPRRRRLLRPRILIGTLLALIVVGGVCFGGWSYLRSQWYVGVDNGQVTIFRGIKSSALGVSLHRVHARYMSVDSVPDFERERLMDGIPASSENSAQHIVNQLSTEQASTPGPTGPPSTGATPTPSGSRAGPSPTASPTTSPTAPPTSRVTP